MDSTLVKKSNTLLRVTKKILSVSIALIRNTIYGLLPPILEMKLKLLGS